MINVTKSFLPPIEEYVEYLKGICERGHLTNHGPLVNELEEKLRNYLDVKHFFFINNGTVALQIAIKALGIKGEVITTPFSYVATTSSIVWENATPAFVDIDPNTFTIDASQIEGAVTSDTSAILATHVYGIPCNVSQIEQIAKKAGAAPVNRRVIEERLDYRKNKTAAIQMYDEALNKGIIKTI